MVWLVDAAAELILSLLGQRPRPGTSVSVEDIESLLRDSTREGILEPSEQLLAGRALRLGDRTVRDIMRPRIEIDALDVDTPPDEVIGAVAMAGFSRLPIHEGDLDHIIGFVYTKDLLAAAAHGLADRIAEAGPARRCWCPSRCGSTSCWSASGRSGRRWRSCWTSSAAPRAW